MIRILHFGKYISVAALSAAGDWLVFSVLVSLLGAPDLTGLMAARVAGGAISFMSNRHWTWGTNRHIALTQQGRRFLLLYGISYGASIALFTGLHRHLGLSAYPAKLLTDGGCFLLNFAVMQVYVFHHRGGVLARLRALLREDGPR
jgi:putative flippase GtrA